MRPRGSDDWTLLSPSMGISYRGAAASAEPCGTLPGTSGVGHKLGKGPVFTDHQCGRCEVSVPDGEPLHCPGGRTRVGQLSSKCRVGQIPVRPYGLCLPGLGQIMPSRKCLEIRQVCWPLPWLARANTVLSNNGALWQPSRACLVADLFGQTPGWHPLLAYAFSLSGTWPKLPLCPEQEVGVSWYPRAGASAPVALLGGARPTGTTHLSSPHFPSGTNTPHASRWPKGSRSPPLQVEGTGWGCCEEEGDQESPRPDP